MHPKSRCTLLITKVCQWNHGLHEKNAPQRRLRRVIWVRTGLVVDPATVLGAPRCGGGRGSSGAPPGRGAVRGGRHARRPSGSAGDTPPPHRRVAGSLERGGARVSAAGRWCGIHGGTPCTADARARRGRATPPPPQRRDTAAAGRSRGARRGVAPELKSISSY